MQIRCGAVRLASCVRDMNCKASEDSDLRQFRRPQAERCGPRVRPCHARRPGSFGTRMHRGPKSALASRPNQPCDNAIALSFAALARAAVSTVESCLAWIHSIEIRGVVELRPHEPLPPRVTFGPSDCDLLRRRVHLFSSSSATALAAPNVLQLVPQPRHQERHADPGQERGLG